MREPAPRAARSETGVFGYGSLVNPRTLPAPARAERATLHGWKRMWGHQVVTPAGPTCALTVKPAEGAQVAGVRLRCDAALLAQLDAREVGYARLAVSVASDDAAGASLPCQVYYSLEPHRGPACDAFPIWRSYLDCVLAGFLELGGEAAVDAFAATTEWFGAPILDDRERPLYARAERLAPAARSAIDRVLAARGLLANLR